MTAPLITYATDGKVVIVTLNRPDKLNAITPELKALLIERFHEADRDPATSVVVVRAEGRSFSAGYDMVMMWDVTIAAHDAMFGEPEIRFSNVGPALVMPFIVGLKRARELLYMGDPIDAQTALQYGMVNRVVPRADLVAATMEFANR